MGEAMEEHRCLICGKRLHDPLAIYCSECEYELNRVRLANEETVEEWIERMMEENPVSMQAHVADRDKIRSLDHWF